jgi:ABC-type transporter Mla subunit MlaD
MDSTVLVRSRSALGLKYVQITPGSAARGFRAGATVPLANATPRPVEIDQVLNTFDLKTRIGARKSLVGLGEALAGRGSDLNEAIGLLPPLLTNLQAVTVNLTDPRTKFARFFPSLARAARIVAPAAQTQAELFANLDTTFTALSAVARPFIQETISQSPPTLSQLTAELPVQRAFLANATALSADLRPGVRQLPATLPTLADALEIGQVTLKRTPPLNAELANVFVALQNFADDPLVPQGIARLNDTVKSLGPTLAFLTPAQVTCNYATLWFRNVSSVLSEGDSHGTWQRFIIIPTPQGPNSESGPSNAPANDPANPANHLHANPYPNSAAPGQNPKECEGGNEPYAVGKTIVGNTPGNQGTTTSGQTP